MSQPMKVFVLVVCGDLPGATVWLCSQVATDVFLAYAQSAALWCF
jgi:hypothetical protein